MSYMDTHDLALIPTVRAISYAVSNDLSVAVEVEQVRYALQAFRTELFQDMPSSTAQVHLIGRAIRLLSLLTDLSYDPEIFPAGHAST